MKKCLAAFAAAFALVAPLAAAAAATATGVPASEKSQSGASRREVADAAAKITRFRQANRKAPTNKRGNKIIASGGTPFYKRDRKTDEFCIIGGGPAKAWYFDSRRETRDVYRASRKEVLASKGACGNVARRDEALIGRAGAVRDIEQVVLLVEAVFSSDGFYPETLTTKQARAAGVTFERGNKIAEYTLVRVEEGDDVYRLCVVDPDGPWASFDSDTAEFDSGKQNQTCRF